MPERSRVYQNHTLDSTRWNFLQFRPDDVVIATSYKAGTTWMQAIVANLVFLGEEPPAWIGDLAIEARFFPLELVLTTLEQQKHRRFMKTHLPLNGFPFDERLKYVYVGRDARDVFMSFWNHYRNFTDKTLQTLNLIPGRVGAELPRCPDDIHDLWHAWTTRGWFDWETEGYPWWSNLANVKSWWDFRHLPNVLFVHFADLLSNLTDEIRRVADFLEIEVPATVWAKIVRNCSFQEMEANAEKYVPLAGAPWREGAHTLFHKGTNGRWRQILTKDELALYEAAANRELTPECRLWLERGGHSRL